MLQRAVQLAEERAKSLDSRQVLDYRPLKRNLTFAALGILSFVSFALISRDAFAIWTQRWLLLSDQNWPRHAYIEVLDFPNASRKVAEGTDLQIRVRAAADRPTPAPQVCTIYYRTDRGDRGRVNMSREGDPDKGFQYYRYEGQPFQGMLDGVQFDVVGMDYRVADLRVDVVASPSMVELQLTSQLPTYLGQPARHEVWRSGLSLPAGSQVTLHGRSSKPLKQVRIEQAESATTTTVDLAAESNTSEFSFAVGRVDVTTNWHIELLDTDDVVSEQPYRVTVNAMEDLPPQVEIRLRGIGSAITPQATIPVFGQIKDDYNVRSAWFQVEVPEKQVSRQIPLPTRSLSPLEQALDLRQQRASSPSDWDLAAGATVVFSVRAQDAYDLDELPHAGQSYYLPLDVFISE